MGHKVKTHLFFAIVGLLLSLQSGAAQIQSDTIKTVFFKITSKGNGHVSYLFGTHHAFGKAFFDSLTQVNIALKACDILVKENLNTPGETAMDIINQRSQVTPWKKYLNKEDLKFIDNLFAASPTDYHKMSPAEMYAFLNRHHKQQFCLNKSADDTSLSLDDYIAELASKDTLGLYGLETVEEQINLINKDIEGMPRKTHQRRLSNIIAKIKTGNNRDCEETNWYSQMAIDYHLGVPCSNALILTDRNETWLSMIKELLPLKNCFIAVGLSHLQYECGLINQLAALGYELTPLEVK